ARSEEPKQTSLQSATAAAPCSAHPSSPPQPLRHDPARTSLCPGEYKWSPEEGVGEFSAWLGIPQPELGTPKSLADVKAVVDELLIEAGHQKRCRPILNRPLRRDDRGASGDQQRRAHRGHLIGKVRHVELRRLACGQHRNPTGYWQRLQLCAAD